jgi:hypothetical protein
MKMFSVPFKKFRDQLGRGNSIISIFTRLRSGRCGVRIPAETRNVLSFPKIPDQLCSSHAFLFNGYRKLFLDDKPPVRKIYRSLNVVKKLKRLNVS